MGWGPLADLAEVPLPLGPIGCGFLGLRKRGGGNLPRALGSTSMSGPSMAIILVPSCRDMGLHLVSSGASGSLGVLWWENENVSKAATRWQANSWQLLDKYDDLNCHFRDIRSDFKGILHQTNNCISSQKTQHFIIMTTFGVFSLNIFLAKKSIG